MYGAEIQAITPEDRATEILGLLFGFDQGNTVFLDPDEAEEAIEDAIVKTLRDNEDAIEALFEVMGGTSAPVGGQITWSQISHAIVELGAQRFMVGSLIKELLLVSPLPVDLLTLKDPDAWGDGGLAFDLLHAAIVSANGRQRGFIFNDMWMDGLSGKGEAAGLADALYTQDVKGLKLVLSGADLKREEQSVCSRSHGQRHPLSSRVRVAYRCPWLGVHLRGSIFLIWPSSRTCGLSQRLS